MGVYKRAVITNAGIALQTQALAESRRLEFTRAVISSHVYLDSTDFTVFTDLEDQEQEVTPSGVFKAGENTIGIRLMFDNQNAEAAYDVQNIGLYARLPDPEAEMAPDILFAVSQASTPDQMPSFDSGIPTSLIYNVQIAISRTEAVSFEINGAGAATVLDLQDIRQSMERIYRNITVNVPVSWSANAPYTQEIAIPGLKVGDPAEIWSAVTEGTAAADAKTWSKMAAMISYAKINEDGKLMLACLNKKPSAAFKIRLKGVSRS